MEVLEILHDTPTVRVVRGRLPDGTPVVCKTRPQRKAQKRSAHAKLRYEMRMLELLAPARCPNVPQAIELVGDEHTLMLVTHDVGGVRLNLVPELKISEILHIAIQVTQALVVVHQSQMVHKDVNPNNIVFNRRSGLTQLIDFELASQLAREKQDGERLLDFEGTPAFLAPEQTGCTNMAVDHRTDLYALGLTLYTLLRGKPPFVNDDISDLVYAILSQPPEPIDRAAPHTPAQLAAVVTKLIQKSPDDRYQSAEGLLYDLQRCYEAWSAHECIPTFALGAHDFVVTLALPQRLFGREAACQQFAAVLDDCVAAKSFALLMIHGPSGIGKSSLLQALQPDILRHRAWLASGEHNAMRQHIPFDALGGAITMMVRRILAESEDEQGSWRRRLQETVGTLGQALVNIAPTLALLLGPQNPVSELGPRETENRLLMLLQDFIATLCKYQPLVLFVDDLHWADFGTLRLLDMLAQQTTTGSGLLVVGSYRSNEVGPEHPLTLLLGRLTERQVHITHISLHGLTQADVHHFLKACTRASDTDIAPLAQRLLLQTDGNPFFLIELVKHLWLQRFIRYQPERHAFGWNLLHLESVSMPVGVVALMTQKLSGLPPDDLRVVCYAACVGLNFELGFLCEVLACSRADAVARLQSALQLGVVVPLTPNYRYAADTETAIPYQFGHDRVRQAAYEMLPKEAADILHGRIGMLLHGRLHLHGGTSIFDALEHLNRARHLIASQQSRQQLADLNMLAATEARKSAAPAVALLHLEMARSLVPLDVMHSHPAWYRTLEMEVAKNEFLADRNGEALRRLDALLPIAMDAAEKCALQSLRITILSAEGSHRAAIEACNEGLRWLGYRINLASAWAVPKQLFDAWRLVWSQTPEHLLGVKVCEDEQVVLAHQLLAACGYSSQANGLASFINVACFGMASLMRRGRTPFYVYGLVGLASLARSLRMPRVWRKLEATVDVLIEQGDYFGPVPVSMTRYWSHAVSNGGIEDSQKIDALYEMSRKAGEMTFAGLTAGGTASTRLYHDLEAFEVKAAAFYPFVSQRGNPHQTRELDVEIEVARRLIGQEAALPDAPTHAHDSPNVAASNIEFHDKLVGLARMLAHNVFGEPQQAYEQLCNVLVPSAWFQVPPPALVDICMHGCLAIADMMRLGHAMRRGYRNRLRMMRGHLRRVCCDSEGEPFEGVRWLVEAEWAAARGRVAAATVLYCQMAHDLEFSTWTSRQAVGFERAGQFFVRQSNFGMALVYLRRAHVHYLRWGALAKACLLADEVRALEQGFTPAQEPKSLPSAEAGTGSVSLGSVGAAFANDRSISAAGGSLGFKALVRAAQAVSKEVVTERVVEKILEALQRVTGATRVALFFVRDDALSLAVDSTPGGELPWRYLTYVMRNKEVSVVDDVKKSLASDPYFEATRAKAVLCAPILQRLAVTGVVYLENELLSHAFSRALVDTVEILAAQASIALENAQAYATLEGQVSRRTEELREAHAKLVAQQVEGTEALMAGGFAHEMRNALSSARMLLGALVPIEAEQAGKTLVDAMAQDMAEMARATQSAHFADAQFQQMWTHIEQLRQRQVLLTEMMTGIAAGVERGLSITHEILKYAQVGSIVPGDHAVLVQHLMHGVLRDFQPVIQAAGIAVEMEIHASASLAMKEEHAYTILRNLFANAVDALARRTDGERRLWLRVVSTGDSVSLSVEDTGIGMTSKTQERVFQPFFTTKGHEGTGLGLGLSRKLASVYGGSLEFRSKEGSGTVFTLTLPRRVGAPEGKQP